VRRKRGRISLDQRAAVPIADDNSDVEYLRLSRREICRTEINAAVRLFLVDEDPISAHLLASAATEIMVALSDGKSGVGLNDMRALMKKAAVSSDLSDEVFQSLLHPYNFLKHGSSDFSVENNFSIEHIVMTIYTAIHSYRVLFGDLSTEMTVFYGIVQSWRIHWWEGRRTLKKSCRSRGNCPSSGHLAKGCATSAGTGSKKPGRNCRRTPARGQKSALSFSA
jgi:hypothetical protein